MTPAVIQFISAALVVIAAGAYLTRSADRISNASGMGRILVGSILLAGATSLPELMVDLNAIWLQQPDLAVGDLLGSSLFNLLILALVDSFFRHPRRAFSRDFAHHSQSAVLSIHLTAMAGIGILSQLSSHFLRVGIFTWLLAGVYVISVRLIYAHAPESGGQGPETSAEQKESKRRELIRGGGGFIASAAVLVIAAPFLVQAADRIASDSGLGHTFVGTTLVAFSTSLPELVATIAAFRLGAPDLALGNIFGSNTFNMLLFLPLDLATPGALFSQVSPNHSLTAFCVIAVSSIAVLGQMSRKREKVRLWEPSSELIILVVLAFLFLLRHTNGG